VALGLAFGSKLTNGVAEGSAVAAQAIDGVAKASTTSQVVAARSRVPRGLELGDLRFNFTSQQYPP